MDWPTDLVPHRWDFHLQNNSTVSRQQSVAALEDRRRRPVRR